jgi:hypothetical protein
MMHLPFLLRIESAFFHPPPDGWWVHAAIMSHLTAAEKWASSFNQEAMSSS